jgi:hypothetical protein
VKATFHRAAIVAMINFVSQFLRNDIVVFIHFDFFVVRVKKVIILFQFKLEVSAKRFAEGERKRRRKGEGENEEARIGKKFEPKTEGKTNKSINTTPVNEYLRRVGCKRDPSDEESENRGDFVVNLTFSCLIFDKSKE